MNVRMTFAFAVLSTVTIADLPSSETTTASMPPPTSTSPLFAPVQACNASMKWDSAMGTCCTQCAVGSGVVLPCTSRADTECSTCETYEFSSLVSHTHSCEQCSKCPKHSRQTEECTLKSNARCECLHGYTARGMVNPALRDSPMDCEECGVCEAGTRLNTSCTNIRDTTCSLCESGHFSVRDSRWCSACRECPNGVATPCTPIADAQCEGVFVTTTSSSPAFDTANWHSGGSKLVPVYVAVLGVLLVALAGYVVAKRCCSTNTRYVKRSKNGAHSAPREQSSFLQTSTTTSRSPPPHLVAVIVSGCEEDAALFEGVAAIARIPAHRRTVRTVGEWLPRANTAHLVAIGQIARRRGRGEIVDAIDLYLGECNVSVLNV